jgi:hypothetical protein
MAWEQLAEEIEAEFARFAQAPVVASVELFARRAGEWALKQERFERDAHLPETPSQKRWQERREEAQRRAAAVEARLQQAQYGRGGRPRKHAPALPTHLPCAETCCCDGCLHALRVKLQHFQFVRRKTRAA